MSRLEVSAHDDYHIVSLIDGDDGGYFSGYPYSLVVFLVLIESKKFIFSNLLDIKTSYFLKLAQGSTNSCVLFMKATMLADVENSYSSFLFRSISKAFT